ncbi:hypothetical protein ACFP9V_03025 [Deinococcus radiopugnans]|uniref:Lipoprotein n=1 Tax=Deinococcus radiopugnans ATCC 19172 TaxID=585398 RepID=A0A5C4Y876_9DEIO|nr:hypothetical protein [Deinococcus radiopugnans]MBB6014820.1 hypothetical protein [Deinococcus radiopugnans ATCC 19172]TNM71751.1 hypothetical protein FHR04_07360 [Deinococcus radiopugnans ATCC 19172]
MFNQTNLKRPAASFTAVIGLSLLLSACGGGGTVTPEPDPKPDPKPTEQVGLIKGQIVPKLSAKVRAEAPKISTEVSAEGKFDLKLPDADSMSTTYQTDLIKATELFGLCDDKTQTDAPASLRVLAINKLRLDDNAIIIAPVNQNPDIYSYKSWVFSEVDAAFSFKGNCVGLDEVTANVVLKRGWNVFDAQINTKTKKTTYELAATPKPEATEYSAWVKSGGGTPAQTLGYNILEPWKNLPQYRNR